MRVRTASGFLAVGRSSSATSRVHVAVTGTGWAATSTLDVALELLPTAKKPLAVRTRIRVHLGTAEVLGRVAQVRAIAPGETSVARLLLERPLVARGGDRFVIRSFSPVTTIGGGVVLDPYPPKRPRVSERGLATGQLPPERLARFVEEAGLAVCAPVTSLFGSASFLLTCPPQSRTRGKASSR